MRLLQVIYLLGSKVVEAMDVYMMAGSNDSMVETYWVVKLPNDNS